MKKNLYMYIYMSLNHFAVQQKLAQHCKINSASTKKKKAL